MVFRTFVFNVHTRIIEISMGIFTTPICSSDFHRKPFDWSYATLRNIMKSQFLLVRFPWYKRCCALGKYMSVKDGSAFPIES